MDLLVVVVVAVLSIEVEKVSAKVVRVVVKAVSVERVVVAAVPVVVVVAELVVAVLVAGGAIAACSPCGHHRKPPHTAATNTNTAAAKDSHRSGKYLGVGTTRF